jgi:hypothetical protein
MVKTASIFLFIFCLELDITQAEIFCDYFCGNQGFV